MAASVTREALQNEELATPSKKARSDKCDVIQESAELTSDIDEYVPQKGDIVAVVGDRPEVYIGKVLRTDQRHREVLLATLHLVEANKYRFDVAAETWRESFDALIYPVDVNYNEVTHLYTLNSSLPEIHSAFATSNKE